MRNFVAGSAGLVWRTSRVGWPLRNPAYASNNNGISAIANGGARVNVFLDRVDISHSSGNGVQAYGSNSFVILNNSAISFTAQAFTPVSGGVTQSYGNNAVRNNTAIGTITVTFGLL